MLENSEQIPNIIESSVLESISNFFSNTDGLQVLSESIRRATLYRQDIRRLALYTPTETDCAFDPAAATKNVITTEVSKHFLTIGTDINASKLDEIAWINALKKKYDDYEILCPYCTEEYYLLHEVRQHLWSEPNGDSDDINHLLEQIKNNYMAALKSYSITSITDAIQILCLDCDTVFQREDLDEWLTHGEIISGLNHPPPCIEGGSDNTKSPLVLEQNSELIAEMVRKVNEDTIHH